jgi:DeoR family lactose phosphotransferase system repressor
VHHHESKAASLIEDGDTLFFGPGTTVELLAEEVNHHTLTIITNCLPVYKILLEKQTAHSTKEHLAKS